MQLKKHESIDESFFRRNHFDVITWPDRHHVFLLPLPILLHATYWRPLTIFVNKLQRKELVDKYCLFPQKYCLWWLARLLALSPHLLWNVAVTQCSAWEKLAINNNNYCKGICQRSPCNCEFVYQKEDVKVFWPVKNSHSVCGLIMYTQCFIWCGHSHLINTAI